MATAPSTDGNGGSDGFAAVDALAGLAILAATIALSISALGTARKVSQAGVEASRAKTTLTSLINGANLRPGSYGGRTAQFDWTLDVSMESPPGSPTSLCLTRGALRAIPSGRRYEYETRRPCPVGEQ